MPGVDEERAEGGPLRSRHLKECSTRRGTEEVREVEVQREQMEGLEAMDPCPLENEIHTSRAQERKDDVPHFQTNAASHYVRVALQLALNSTRIEQYETKGTGGTETERST